MPAAIRTACLASLKVFGVTSSFNVSAGPNLTGLAAFVAAGIITQDQSDALTGLAIVPATRAQVLFGAGAVVQPLRRVLRTQGDDLMAGPIFEKQGTSQQVQVTGTSGSLANGAAVACRLGEPDEQHEP